MRETDGVGGSMHARVVTYIGQLGKASEIVRGYHEQITPAARQQPGFAGGLLLTDPATGKVIVISLWETEAAMVKGEADGYMQTQLARIRRLAASTPVLEHFEVSEAVPFIPHISGDAVRASGADDPAAPWPAD